MSDATARRLAWAVFALCAVELLAGVALIVLAGSDPGGPAMRNEGVKILEGDPISDALSLLALFSSPVVGVLIVARQPRNSIGWLLLAVGLAWGLAIGSQGYADYGFGGTKGSLPRPDLVTALTSSAWVPAVGLMGTFLLLLFPDGSLPGPRWRHVARLSALVMGLLFFLSPVIPGTLPEVTGDSSLPPVPNPLGIEVLRPLLAPLNALVLVLVLCIVASALSIVDRFRRSSAPQRLQLKWFAAGGGVAAALYLAMMASVVADELGLWTRPEWFIAVEDAAVFSFALIPGTIGMAILRYRLYDIDVVINKTVVYASLAVFIGAVYVAVVVGLGALLGSRGEPNAALSIFATAIVAVAFQPVRERVQRFANRLVYGQRATAYEVLTRFSRSLAGVSSVDDVVPEIARHTAEGLQAELAVVTVQLPRGAESARYPQEAAVAASGFTETVPVTYRGDTLGEIAVTKPASEPFTPPERKLLAQLASHAGVVLHNYNLALELRARLDELGARAEELRRSRARLVTAADRSRRAIEGAIRERIEARLTTVARELDAAEAAMAAEPERVTVLLDDIAARTNETLEALRDLARGIYPPLLADKGLVMALEADIRKAGLDATVIADDELSAARFERSTETAAYFCVREALENIARHAPGASARVTLERRGERLAFSVGDDGPGFDPATTSNGHGVQSMADRIAASGGELSVSSAPGRGTTVQGWLPVAAQEEETAGAQAPVAAAHASSS